MENTTRTLKNSDLLEFSFIDYGLFLMMLLLSVLIGIYFGFIKKQATANDYLLGGKTMSVYPISMSLVASYISGVTMLAVPVDIYMFGATYWLLVPMLATASIIAYYMFIPVFYELQLTSTYEYLERRFCRSVRTFASVLYTLSTFMYLPIVIYIPALALSQATGFSVHAITPVICGVCIFYTTLGGLKAVVWTDALQLIIICGTTVGVLYLGIKSAGGVGEIWQRNKDYGRLDINYNVDVTKRDTFWTGTVGLLSIWVCNVGVSQSFLQKCIALPNYKDVRNAIIIFVVGMAILVSTSIYTGLIIFAKYYDCDPLTSGTLSEPDQLLPHYIMDVGKLMPGLSGLFVAGIFSASLSTLSAVMNCLAATLYEDFVSRFVPKGTNQKTISNYLKILAATIGIVCTGLVFFVPYLGSLLQLTVTIGGITSGALLGLFIAGMFLPSVNAKGVLWGGIVSLSIMAWIVAGSQYYKMLKVITYPHLPLITDGCQNLTLTNITETLLNNTSTEEPLLIYRISYYYYTLMGIAILLTISIIVSKLSPEHDRAMGKEYFSPLIRGIVNNNNNEPPDYYSLEETKRMINLKDRP